MQVQLKGVAEEMQAIHKGLEKVEHELAASEHDGKISDGFRQVSPLLFGLLKLKSLQLLLCLIFSKTCDSDGLVV